MYEWEESQRSQLSYGKFRERAEIHALKKKGVDSVKLYQQCEFCSFIATELHSSLLAQTV